MSSRRRLRVICSSDEEDGDDEIQEIQPPLPQQQHDDIECETLNFQDVTLNSINSNPTNPSDPIQVVLSDDDFIDATEDLFPSPQSPPPPPPPPSEQTVISPEYSRTSSVGTRASSVGTSEASGCPISRILEDLGLRLRGEWLDCCLRNLQTAVPGFSSFDATKKAKLCFEKFLHSDMNNCGAGMLPDNVHQMHLVDLPGPYVLQVDEIVNISQSLRDRYKKAPSGLKRCLKLSMTDGVHRVFGMEYQPIKDLEALAPAGLKVAISNVHVRHGLLMLVPEVIQVLGGLVEELDAARQRLVNEVNKPPRGKRTRTGVVPPLATRATRAAWPAENTQVSEPSNNPVSQSATPPIQVNNHQGNTTTTTTPPSVNTRVSSNTSAPAHVVHPVPRVQVEAAVSSFSTRVSSESSNASFAAPVLNQRVREEATVSVSIPAPVDISDDVDAHMADGEESYSTYGRSSETPFTYMASLSVKWVEVKDKVSHVQAKIKCFVTGVKGFQFKKRSTYELQVYVDDGSLISEILIDHNVVQRKIGYSPEEVNAALSSPDPTRVHDMKDTMMQFQFFLVNFEGTMVVRINEASSLPVAIEMEQGCSPSDAWSLLTRLKSSQPSQHQQFDPIDLSP